MEQVKTITWICRKEGSPYEVRGKGLHLFDAFMTLPKYRQLQAVHGLIGFEINGVRQ